jgi:CRISPR/Cas system CSM-associated protein Csm3 (group 7 of RAMP superfamily)
MPRASWSGSISRKIVRRIIVEGELVLQTPAHFGNGDSTDLVDMPLLTDSLDGKTPLLPGASIAGALRSYVREREHGFRAKADTNAGTAGSASILLFGGNKGDEYGEQSPLLVEDALGKYASVELRDGVRVNGESRTAEEEKLFNIEMWEAGTTFPLRFELIVRQQDDQSVLRQALATALAGFNDGSITLGARKRRGYGQVSVAGWRVREYDLANSADLLDWIANGSNALSGPVFPDIAAALNVGTLIDDHRHTFRLHAEFSLDGSLLIRSGSGPEIRQEDTNAASDQGPDTVHLHSARPASSSDGRRERRPILSGTSLAGALRARALKIARLIAPPTKEGVEDARQLIDSMFGADMDVAKNPEASRVIVYERVVTGVENTSVQNRVSLDRFTGSTRDGALFNEQPLFGGEQSLVTVCLRLENPQAYEIGLLLLLLKDLWTGDLPLGGESSIGRGRLRGTYCHLEYLKDAAQTWELLANGANDLSMTAAARQELERYVTNLHTHLSRSKP